MTALALVAAKGAPGVTTSALLLAAVWPRPACLVEADPAGGDLRWWHTDARGEPLRPDIGVVSLLAGQHGERPDRLDPAQHTQTLAGGLAVLVGVGTAAQHQALGPVWPRLTAAVDDPQAAQDYLVDGGRLTSDPAQHAMLGALPLVLLVCRPSLASVAHTRHALERLRTPAGRRPALGVLVIGGPGDRSQVAAALGPSAGEQQLYVGQLAHEPAAAGGLAGSWTRGLDRSALVASGRRLAEQLCDELARLAPISTPHASGSLVALVGESR